MLWPQPSWREGAVVKKAVATRLHAAGRVMEAGCMLKSEKRVVVKMPRGSICFSATSKVLLRHTVNVVCLGVPPVRFAAMYYLFGTPAIAQP